MALESAMAIYRAWCQCCVLAVFDFIFARAPILSPTMESNTLAVVALLLVVVLISETTNPRRECLQRERLNWRHHSQLLLNEGQFKQYYRMSFRSFDRLTRLLAPSLRVNEAQSRRRTGGVDPLSPVNKVQMLVSWLAGYSFHPVRVLSGTSKTGFYDSIHQVMDAIIAHDELQLRFPVTEESLQQSAAGFARRSKNRVLVGCVGAIDGWLCRIQVPRRTEVKRVTSFFSGHYQCYGVNVQACVDHHSRFTAVTCNSPGGMGDALAFLRWKLSRIVEEFPVGIFLAGDNAYSNSNKLLTPFTRPQTTNSYRDAFNFHLSQLRIRVEMAFGYLVNKWRIFKSPLRVRVANVQKVVNVACILHNWCINERLREDNMWDVSEDDDVASALSSVGGSPAEPNIDLTVGDEDVSLYRRLYLPTQVYPEQTSESELLRNAYVAKLRELNLLRPGYNIRRAALERASQRG